MDPVNPPIKRPRGRPKGCPGGPGRAAGSQTKAGGKTRRIYPNGCVFVGQAGERVPVLRLLVTLPAESVAKLDAVAALLGTSASGALCCLVDELPDPRLVAHSPATVPVGEDAGPGWWRPLWLPTILGGKLMRYLATTKQTVNQFVGGLVQTMPEPGQIVPPKPAFAGPAEAGVPRGAEIREP